MAEVKLIFPTQNYHRMPNSLTSDVLKTLSRTEILVLLYLIRHLWGFGEQEAVEPKRISHDEFIHGRLQKNGTRIDSGTGVSRSTLIPAIHSLIERGLIAREVDESDKARIKHYYYIDAIGEGSEKRTSDVRKPDMSEGSEKRTPRVRKTDLDHKKETKKETKDVATPPGPADPTELTTQLNGSNSKAKRRQDKPVHPFDEKALAHFLETLDLAKVKYNPKHKSKWLNELRLLREHDHAEMDDIKLVLKWYREYYPPRRGTDGTFTAHCIPTLRRKFFKFLAAAQDAKQNPKTIVNGIQLLTAKDAEKIHETESDIGHCHYLLIHPDWYVGDFYADPSAHYQLMADIINESIRNDPDDALSWRHHLRKFGVGYLVKKHEG